MGLADEDFPPNPGSVNPFVAGTRRGIGTYTLHLVFGPAPTPPAPGTIYANVASGAVVTLVYRVYLADTGATASGNVPLPVFSISPDAAAARRVAMLERRAWTFPAAAWPANVAPEARAAHAPYARMSPRTAHPAAIAPAAPYVRVGGGPGWFTNVDEAALFGSLPISTMQLYVLRFTAPTTPRTLAGEPFTVNTQLRYWSVCVYSTNYLPYKCLADEQVPQKPPGWVIVVMGAPAARPSNANAANGVAWLGLGPGATIFAALIRNILPAPNFTMSAFAVPIHATPGPYMGPYAPVAVTCATADFEANECVRPTR